MQRWRSLRFAIPVHTDATWGKRDESHSSGAAKKGIQDFHPPLIGDPTYECPPPGAPKSAGGKRAAASHAEKGQTA
jgi:hypothetical protein